MSKLLPPTYLLGALVAVGVLHWVIPGPRLLHGPWRVLGLVPLAIGVWLNLWADRLFKQVGTAVQPFQDSTELVSTGPYGFSRHPMYLGMAAITLGAAVVAGSMGPLAAVVALWWLLDRRFVEPEERAMTQQFGTQYEEYRRRVRRWLGWRTL
jgi:protein-S-isoprenylcysteine O-methyltransferase Ste14